MKVGVQLPEVERVVGWDELLAIARRAEDGGFDSLWVGDHLLYDDPPRGPLEAWSVLSALAAVTSRVEIGPLVACLGFHNPAVLAKTAATVDEISGGRLILGVGAGWNRIEFDAFGIPYDRRVERFTESFAIVRMLLAGERVEFAGRHHSVDGAVLLPRPRRVPPLVVGSIGERMLDITLPHVQAHHAWYSWFGNNAHGLRALEARIDEACEKAGRASDEVARFASLYVGLPGGRGRRTAYDETPIAPIPLQELAGVLTEIEAAGTSHVQLVLDPIDQDSVAQVAATLFE